MFTREELGVIFKSPNADVAQAMTTMLVASKGGLPKELTELVNALGTLMKVLYVHPDADVPGTLTNVFKGMTAQVRVAIAVATDVEED